MLALFAALLLESSGAAPDAQSLYRRACGACHGDQGDGRGEAARNLDPAPADFRRGVYKLRSTPTGSLPSDADLARTLRQGVPGTSMPAFAELLSEADIRAIVRVVRAFSDRFSNERIEPLVSIPVGPRDDATSRERGGRLYALYGCAQCHGRTGRGDGPATRTLRDDRGTLIRSYDFTTPGRMKGGNRAADVYRTLATGMDGTPMPSYGDSIPAADIWHLAHYVRSLVRKRTWWDWLVGR